MSNAQSVARCTPNDRASSNPAWNTQAFTVGLHGDPFLEETVEADATEATSYVTIKDGKITAVGVGSGKDNYPIDIEAGDTNHVIIVVAGKPVVIDPDDLDGDGDAWISRAVAGGLLLILW